MLLNYDCDRQQFDVDFGRDVQPVTVQVFDVHHRPLEAWDLHVGAALDLCGRMVTLKTCNLETQEWLCRTARRLRRTFDRLWVL